MFERGKGASYEVDSCFDRDDWRGTGDKANGSPHKPSGNACQHLP